MSRIGAILELVSDIAFGSGGTATSKGDGDHELESAVGWQFGFYSRPNNGCNGFVLKNDGQGNHSLLLAYRDSQYEMTLQQGEVGIANAFGASLFMKNDGSTHINGTIGDDPKTGQYSLVKWELFYAAFVQFVTDLSTVANAGQVATAGGDMLTTLGAQTDGYSNTTVKHG